MEDSLELPEQYDDFQVQTLLSPPPQYPDSKHTTPPHSLAYSASTCAKDKLKEIQFRSPLAFEDSPYKMGLIKSNNENFPLNQQKTVPISPQKREDSPQPELAVKSQCISEIIVDRKVQPKKVSSSKSPPKTNKTSPQSKVSPLKESPVISQQERKTIDKLPNQSKRIRELEQALHMQTVISQQLRTKLSVTNSLLQSKMKEQGLSYLLSMKNSSRDMKNVDIFVELNNLQKQLVQKNIIQDRLKNQLKQLQLQHQKLKHKKHSSPMIVRSPNKTLNDELQKLMEEKESLMGYIEEQKETLKRKVEYIAELEQEINRISDKSTHYTQVERPKLISQMGTLKMENRDLRQDLERIRMQMNLCELKSTEDVQNANSKLKAVEETLFSQQKVIQQLKTIETSRQNKVIHNVQVQKDDVEYEILRKQLTLLKSERDHYLAQYRKRTEESAILYSLQLKMSMLQEQSN